MINFECLDSNSKQIINNFMDGNKRIKRTILSMIHRGEGLDKLVESNDVQVQTALIDVKYQLNEDRLLNLKKFNDYHFDFLQAVVEEVSDIGNLECIFKNAPLWTRITIIKRAMENENYEVIKKILSYDLFDGNKSYYNYVSNSYQYYGGVSGKILNYEFIEEVANLGLNFFKLFGLNLPIDILAKELRRGHIPDNYLNNAKEILDSNLSDMEKFRYGIKNINNIDDFSKCEYKDEYELLATIMSDMDTNDKIAIINKYRNSNNAGLARLAYKCLEFI